MGIRDVVLEGRVEAEAIMEDACVVMRPTGGVTTDPVTGETVPAMVQVYPLPDQVRGACRLQSGVAVAAQPVAGGHLFTVEQLKLFLPVSSALQVGDQATITEAWDPDLIGLVMRLTEMPRGSHRTQDRWSVESVTA